MRKARVGKSLIASVTASYTKGIVKLKLKLNKVGRKLLKDTRRLKVIEKARFTPTGGRAVTVTKTIILTK